MNIQLAMLMIAAGPFFRERPTARKSIIRENAVTLIQVSAVSTRIVQASTGMIRNDAVRS